MRTNTENADHPRTTFYDTAAGRKRMTVAVRDALHRCRMTSLGNCIPQDADAKLLHDAGLATTPQHWFVTLNRYGWDALQIAQGRVSA